MSRNSLVAACPACSNPARSTVGLATLLLIGLVAACAPAAGPTDAEVPTALTTQDATDDIGDQDEGSGADEDSVVADETPMSVDVVGPGIWVVRAELPSPDGEHLAIFEQEGPWPMDAESGNRAVLRLKIVPAGSESAEAGATPDAASGGSVVTETVQTGFVIPTIALDPYQWSDDGSALYWRRVSVGDGCRQFLGAADLHRWDLANETDTVLVEAPGLEAYECDPCPLEPTVSPDGRRVAFLTEQEGTPGVILRTVQTPPDASEGETPAAALPSLSDAFVALDTFDQAGSVTWSPSGDEVAVVTATSPCENELRDLVVIDVDSGAPRVLIDDDPNVPYIVEWSDRGIVVRDGTGGWLIDPSTGEREVFRGE